MNRPEMSEAEAARWMVIASRAYAAYGASVDGAYFGGPGLNERTGFDDLPRQIREGWACAAREACKALTSMGPGPGRDYLNSTKPGPGRE